MTPQLMVDDTSNMIHHSRRIPGCNDSSVGSNDEQEFDRRWLEDEDDDSDDSCSSIGREPVHNQERKVQFVDDEENLHHSIISLSEFSDTELDACWYTSEERERSKAECEKVLHRLEQGKPCKKRNEMSYRGLECRTASGCRQFSDDIDSAIAAVMDEQDRQWAHCFDDAGLLAAKSVAVTGRSIQRALEIAQEDEEEARQLYKQHGQDDSGVALFSDGLSWYRPHKRGNRRSRKSIYIGRGRSTRNKPWSLSAMAKVNQIRQP